LPYLPGKTFWYAGIEDYGTFVAYNKQFLDSTNISNSEVISRMEINFPDNSQQLLLLTSPLDYPELHDFKLLYKVDKDVFGYNREQFFYTNLSKNIKQKIYFRELLIYISCLY